MKIQINQIIQAKNFIQERIGQPKIGLILGSGLGGLTEKIADKITLPYDAIPFFPQSTVAGHKGELIKGLLGEKDVLVFNGRFHYYEGYDLDKVTFPIRIMAELGIENLIITNAAGGVNPQFNPGDLMLITDHLNFTGLNPLRGGNLSQYGTRFPDMTEAYCLELQAKAKEAAQDLKLELKTGVYAWMTGPNYETPSEIKALSILGASAVGMSTVPEVIVANHSGIKVLGLSYITNMGAGILDGKLEHAAVVKTAESGRAEFQNLIHKIIKTL